MSEEKQKKSQEATKEISIQSVNKNGKKQIQNILDTNRKNLPKNTLDENIKK